MQDDLAALVAALPDELSTEEGALRALDLAESIVPPPASDRVRSLLAGKEKGGTVGLHRLLARSLEAEEEPAEADRVLLGVVERLNQHAFWHAMARTAATLLLREPEHAAPLLSRARHQSPAAVDDDLLEAAHAASPRHAFLAWQVAESRFSRGDEASARRLAAKILPDLVADKNLEAAEGALLFVIESPVGLATRSLCRAIELLARQEAWEEFETFVTMGRDLLATEAGCVVSWPVIRELWQRHPEREDLRDAATRIVRAWVRGYPDPDAIVRVSEIDRPSQGADIVLERLRRALRFPPGYYASHHGFGIGKVLDNDTEAVVIDFPAKPRHRMSFATAENALTPLPPRDLRVILAHDPAEAQRLRREDPVELVVMALRCLKGEEGTLEAVRKALVPAVVPGTGWAAWWKPLQERVTQDPRVDARRAFEGHYRLRRPEDVDTDAVDLPFWHPKQEPKKNLGVLDTFLEQHPGERERLLAEHGDWVRRILAGKVPEDRARAALWLARWDPGSSPSVGEHLVEGFDFNAFGKADQERLLAASASNEALVAALDSRLAAIRKGAWDRLETSGDLGAAVRDVLDRATTLPEAALHVLETGLLEPRAPRTTPDLALAVLLALVDFLERPPRETHQKRARLLLELGSPVGKRLSEAPIPEDLQGKATTRLKHWTGSDRFRFPLLDFLRATGNAEIAEEVEGHRARSAARLSDRLVTESDDPYDGALLLTRPSFDRLQAEHYAVGMELKTTIPRAIQKARELGDLKENAEYDAAKLKQKNYATRFEELEGLLNRARLIESLDRRAETALPGTEVRLEAASPGVSPAELVVWLLGEGDQGLDASVVSYKAPIGAALHGKRVGDRVELPGSDAYRIVSVSERLPG